MITGIYHIAVHYNRVCVLGEFVVRLSHLVVSVCVGAVLVVLALAFLDPELAELRLVIVVLDVHHFENQLSWQRLFKING